MTDCNVKYRDWLQEWLVRIRGGVKESTWANYSVAVMNHILPALGEYTLEELTEEKLQETVFFWLRQGRLDGSGGLSGKTVKDLANVVKGSLRAARRYYHLPPQDISLRCPGTALPRMDVLTASEQKRLVCAALSEGNCRSAGILISLYTGLRIGELCALQWKDIDLKGRIVHVRKTVQRIFYKEWTGATKSSVVITAPKTRSAARDVPLASFLVPLLRELHCSDPETYVLSGDRKCLEPKTYRTFYKRFLERNNLPMLRFHGLRHTFATLCIEDGADCKTVSALLGHASVNLTLSLYVHPQIEQKRKCIERLPVYESRRAARRF